MPPHDNLAGVDRLGVVGMSDLLDFFIGDDMKFEELKGKTLVKIENKNNDELLFTTANGEIYKLYHKQECCESVSIDDICGDLDDLIGEPIIEADEVTSSENPPGVEKKQHQKWFTWTFYKIGTAKGFVTIRWYGESSGYYSESVDFCKVV